MTSRHDITAMTETPEREEADSGWQRINRDDSVMLYTLREEGYRRGKPVMVNDVMVNITRGHGSDADLQSVADRIAAALAQMESNDG